VKLPVQIQGTSAAAAVAVATSECVYIWRNESYKLLENGYKESCQMLKIFLTRIKQALDLTMGRHVAR